MSYYRAKIKYLWDGSWESAGLIPQCNSEPLDKAITQIQKGLEDGEQALIATPPTHPRTLYTITPEDVSRKEGDPVEIEQKFLEPEGMTMKYKKM